MEYGLKEISYEAKSGTCHELKVLARPDDPLVFHFEDEQEAQAWWAAVSSSLREVHKGRSVGRPGRGPARPALRPRGPPREGSVRGGAAGVQNERRAAEATLKGVGQIAAPA